MLPSVIVAAALGWLVVDDYFDATSSDGSFTDFAFDGLHLILNDEERGLWWNEPRLATQGCLLKRKSKFSEEAKSFCDRALELSPDDPKTLFEVGMYRRSAGQKLEAIPLLRKAADGGISKAPAFLALTYLSTQDVEAATEWVRRARLNASDEPYSWSVSCIIEAGLFLDDYGSAVSLREVKEICLKAKKVAPNDEFMRGLDANIWE